MNGWFFVGGLAGIALTIVAEVVVAFLFALPRDGVDLDDVPEPDVPASEVVARFTNGVKVHRVGPATTPAHALDLAEMQRRYPTCGVCGVTIPAFSLHNHPPSEVIDLRDRQPATTPEGAA